jgi:predicted nucleic acid-binding protein
VQLRYWDSDCFLGILNEEPDKVDECQAVLEQARAGHILIVTSALTLAEVIKMKRRAPVPPEDAEKIRAFFKHSYISVRNLERYIAETARELLWQHSVLQPKDAVHVATAVRLQIPLLNTCDGDLIGLNGQIGNPALVIERPCTIEIPPEPLPQSAAQQDLGLT